MPESMVLLSYENNSSDMKKTINGTGQLLKLRNKQMNNMNRFLFLKKHLYSFGLVHKSAIWKTHNWLSKSSFVQRFCTTKNNIRLH